MTDRNLAETAAEARKVTVELATNVNTIVKEVDNLVKRFKAFIQHPKFQACFTLIAQFFLLVFFHENIMKIVTLFSAMTLFMYILEFQFTVIICAPVVLTKPKQFLAIVTDKAFVFMKWYFEQVQNSFKELLA
jgi:membrane-bound ClpP family serine protease